MKTIFFLLRNGYYVKSLKTIFVSRMLSDSDFGSGTDDQRFWSSGWTEPEEDRSQPIGIDSQSEEENSDRPKCPICLVNSTLNVQTNCGHDFCLQCIFRMWTSENSDNGNSL